MKKNTRLALLVTTIMALLTALPAFAKPVTWLDDFVRYQTPSSEQCQAWHDFLDQLDPGLEFLSVTMNGTYAPEGVTITDPAAAQELAYLLYSRTSGSVTSDGHTWSVYIGCNLTSCVDKGEGVELRVDQDSGCSCTYSDSNYTIRPDVGNDNWGGVNSQTCSSQDQTMMVAFETTPEMDPTIMVGECNSGVPNIGFDDGDDVNDLIDDCAANAKNHGAFVSCVTRTLNILKEEGYISGKDKKAVMDCATKADMP